MIKNIDFRLSSILALYEEISISIVHYNWKKNMHQKKQPYKSFLDISNTYVKLQNPPNLQIIQNLITRRSERTLDAKKTEDKYKENYNQNGRICPLTSNKCQRSSSQIFNKSFNNLSIRQHQNEVSLNTSTIIPPLSKRFQRKSEKKVEIVNFLSSQKCDMSKQKANSKEEHILKQPNEILKKYQVLQTQNMKLKESVIEKDKKIYLLNSLIKDKDGQIKKTNENLAQKQNIVKQLQENVIIKSKMILKLQQKSLQVEIKLAQSKTNRATLNIEAEFTQKMNLLYERLRYRQMEVHMLKKQLFQYKEIEKKLRMTSKQNFQLKQRIKFLVKKKYLEEIDCESNSSLSYSCLSFAPDEITQQK